ncbi:hypothetical protein L873DRAFT_1236621 [Choiromyces venosus 120613-1]|uniref:Uncharacterized protein n=1 Tax=Choiromyces venosus 120613-1 TaxID=1336337 RepID=A0A3N4JGC0_9PEZI|nr:hypothetical protein L873DRAFT_1236621 [Choiromyces venosus 120613-1]
MLGGTTLLMTKIQQIVILINIIEVRIELEGMSLLKVCREDTAAKTSKYSVLKWTLFLQISFSNIPPESGHHSISLYMSSAVLQHQEHHLALQLSLADRQQKAMPSPITALRKPRYQQRHTPRVRAGTEQLKRTPTYPSGRSDIPESILSMETSEALAHYVWFPKSNWHVSFSYHSKVPIGW